MIQDLHLLAAYVNTTNDMQYFMCLKMEETKIKKAELHLVGRYKAH